MTTAEPATKPRTTHTAIMLLVFAISLALSSGARAQVIPWPDLPEPVTSFGADALDGYIYVFGGHIGEAHLYDDESQLATLHRLSLRRPIQWEALESDQRAQGTALVAHNNMLYRVAGMQARNAYDQPEDLHSLSSVSVFDHFVGEWMPATPLPEGRSSHDAIVLNNTLYVVGGWFLSGGSDSGKWSDHGYAADLTQQPLQWKRIAGLPTPTRALMLATADDRVYAIGGMTDEGTANAVYSYDPASDTWRDEPAMPVEGRMKAFGVGAIGIEHSIYASAYNGKLFRFDTEARKWIDTDHTLEQQRFFHRIVTDGERLIFLGGAGTGGHTAKVESVSLEALAAQPITSLDPTRSGRLDAVAMSGSTRWAGFRGDGSSRTEARNLPIKWSEEPDDSGDSGVAWRTKLPGIGQSSPVIFDGSVYATSIVHQDAEPLKVSRVDAQSGAIEWTRSFAATQLWPNDDYSTKSSPTPVVDASGVYASWETGNLVAIEHNGTTRWTLDFAARYGPLVGNHGYGSSVAQDDERLYLLIDHGGPSRFIALDKSSGSEVWNIEREKRTSWTSPLVIGHGESSEVIISSNGVLQSFDGATGSMRWSIDEITGNTIQSPSIRGDLLVIGAGKRGGNLGFRLSGDGSAPSRLWDADRVASDFASPLIGEAGVYFVTSAGVAVRVDRETGETDWSLRLPAGCWASPMLNAGRVYFFCKNGQTVVVGDVAGSEPVLVGEGAVEVEGVVYGAAAVDGRIVLRDEGGLTGLGD